ncbi:hypothetical protein Hanom_Chr08g00744431 [Helianthus anomalus]
MYCFLFLTSFYYRVKCSLKLLHLVSLKSEDESSAAGSTNGHLVSHSSSPHADNVEINGKPFDGIPSHSHHRAASSGCIASLDRYETQTNDT